MDDAQVITTLLSRLMLLVHTQSLLHLLMALQAFLLRLGRL
jgi:hypothetical protein